MLCLRHAAFRALTSPCLSTSIKSRSITNLQPSFTRRNLPKSCLSLQRRFASEDVTQAEPEADGATEAQHGENSIASSSVEEDTSIPKSADQENHSTVASAISSAAETASTKASDMVGSVTEAAAGASRYFAPEGNPGTNIYVGNLFFDVTEDTLKRDFAQFGQINSIKIIVDGRGLSKGFGYIDFADVASATKAVEAMNQRLHEGRRLTVQYSVKKDRTERTSNSSGQPTKTLFIGNMSFEMSDQDLNDMFREIRDVTDVRVAIDRRTGQPRGFAHAEFNSESSAEKALQILNGKEMYGRKLRVDYSVGSSRSRAPQ